MPSPASCRRRTMPGVGADILGFIECRWDRWLAEEMTQTSCDDSRGSVQQPLSAYSSPPFAMSPRATAGSPLRSSPWKPASNHVEPMLAAERDS